MKKILSLLLITATLAVMLVSCSSPDSSEPPVTDPSADVPPEATSTATDFKVDGVPVYPIVLEEPGISFMNNVDIIFRFAMDNEMYKLINKSFGEVTFVGVAGVYEPDAIPTYANSRHLEPEYLGLEEKDGKKYRSYVVRLTDVLPENYGVVYTANLYMCFKSAQTEYTVPVPTQSMPKARVFTAALFDYTDRSETQTEKYAYPADNGTFSPYEDLTPYYSVLASCLYLDIEGNNVTDVANTDYYESPYQVEYFDGVLEISMKNGSAVNKNILRSIVVNGEKLYFEIVDGIIRLVYFPD